MYRLYFFSTQQMDRVGCSANEKRARRPVLVCLAETEGFEPSMRLYTPYSLSRGAPSATRSRFLENPRIMARIQAESGRGGLIQIENPVQWLGALRILRIDRDL